MTTNKRLDLMQQCLNALSNTLIDIGLGNFASTVNSNCLAINVELKARDPQGQAVRFIEAMVLYLRQQDLNASYSLRTNGVKDAFAVYPYDLLVTDHDGAQHVLPLAARYFGPVAGTRGASLNVTLG